MMITFSNMFYNVVQGLLTVRPLLNFTIEASRCDKARFGLHNHVFLAIVSGELRGDHPAD